MPFYEYATMHLKDLPFPCFRKRDDQYSTEKADTMHYEWLIRNRFRWVRTEGEIAIFELVLSEYDHLLKFQRVLRGNPNPSEASGQSSPSTTE